MVEYLSLNSTMFGLQPQYCAKSKKGFSVIFMSPHVRKKTILHINSEIVNCGVMVKSDKSISCISCAVALRNCRKIVMSWETIVMSLPSLDEDGVLILLHLKFFRKVKVIKLKLS